MSLAILFHFLYAQHVSDTNMYPSSGACDYAAELPHMSLCPGSLCVGDLVWLGWSGIRVAG